MRNFRTPAIRLLCVTFVVAAGCPFARDESHGSSSGSAAHGDQHWTQYGYDLGNTQNNRNEDILDASNVARLREHWRLRVPDGATSTPAIAQGTAYFGAWNGHFYAVDVNTGAIQWDRRLTPRLIRSTALVTRDRIYVGAGVSLVALDRKTGATLFERVVDPGLETLIDASPKLVDGLVLIGVSNFENTSDKSDYTSIGALIAYDADSGDEVWRVQTTGDPPGVCTGGAGVSVWSSPAIDPALGLLYIGTGQTFEPPASTCNDSLLAIRYAREYAGERIVWKQTYTSEDVYSVGRNPGGPDADIGASPNLFEARGRALVGVGDKGGSYRAFDRETGEPIWRRDLKIGEPPLATAIGGVMTTAAVSGDTLYVASNALKVGGWIFNSVNDPADTGTLYALDTATGADRWTVDLPSPMIGSFAIANGLLYHPILSGRLFARELETGEEVWSIDLVANLGSAPSIVSGRLYISAGAVINGNSGESGGFIAGFGLGDQSSIVRDAPPDVLDPLDAEQCKASLNHELIPTPECGECLCACDATAAGHCDVCFALASCTNQFCSTAQPGDDMRQCLAMACGTKLLPTFLFDRAVDVGPCISKCAATCGL